MNWPIVSSAPACGETVHVQNCPVCSSARFKELYAGNFSGGAEQAMPFFLTDRVSAVHGRIVRCEECSFVLTSPQFPAEDYDRIYRDVASIEKPYGRSIATRTRFGKLSALTRRHVKGGRFFDFGCGDGQFLESMPGFEGVGLELRGDGSAPVQSRRGCIIVGDLGSAIGAGMLQAKSFDFVTAWDVFEHLPYIAREVQALRSLIRPSGWLFCSVPNVASLAARVSGERWNCYLLEHLWYFAPRTLSAFMARNGFETEEIRAFAFPADLGTLAERVRQTYGVTLPVPRAFSACTMPIPAGVMFGAFRLKA